jgi:hypothetical protein
MNKCPAIFIERYQDGRSVLGNNGFKAKWTDVRVAQWEDPAPVTSLRSRVRIPVGPVPEVIDRATICEILGFLRGSGFLLYSRPILSIEPIMSQVDPWVSILKRRSTCRNMVKMSDWWFEHRGFDTHNRPPRLWLTLGQSLYFHCFV